MPINQESILRAFLAAVEDWHISEIDAGLLVGVEGATVAHWQSGTPFDAGEEVVARMIMVAKIRTALDIYWSDPLCNKWMTLPNKGELYGGQSPLAYIAAHGWPGLFWVLCQVQAWAIGN